MDRELFITRLAFINNDEIDTIDKNSSIAYLKALYQCENSIAINYNQEELFTQATAINNLGYNSTFTKIFILDKENLNDAYLDARKRLYKSINTLKEKRNEKIKDIQDYLNKEISLQDNLNNQSFNTKENDVNLILNEVFNIEQFYDKNTNTIVLKTNNIKIVFLDKVNLQDLQDNSNNTSFISMSNLIHIYDNHCDIFAKDRSVLDIKDIEEKYQIDFKSLDTKIFLNSTLLTGSNELPNNPFYFGELDQDNTIKQDTPSYYFSPKDESSGLGRLSIFYKNDELCLLNYSILENSLNIKLECLSKQSLEYKDLISNTLKEQKTTQVDKKQAIAKLHALLENQNLECIHGGKVILKSNKGKTFKDDGVPIMLESDLLNSSIVACPNTIAGVSVPCTKVVNVKGSLSQKKVNNEYVILQELISACKTDKGFALKVSFTPTKFKFDHSFDPKEGLGEQSKNQIELKEPIIRLHYKSDRFQKDNLPIYNLLINNEKKEQNKALNEFNIDLKDLKDIEDINILNQFKQDFSKDYEFKELNLSFDTNLIKLYFIIPKNIAKVYKSAYKEFENKDLGVGYFTQLHEYDKIIKNALEDNKELNEYHFSFLAPAKMQNLKLQIAQGLDEILEDEDRKQELYVCKFVVVNGVSENNAQEKITHLSNDGQNLLKNIEKLRLKPYNDQNGKEITSYVKGATIGYGHLIGQNEWDLYKNGITLQEADKLFKSDLLPFENAVKNSINSSLAQNEFDALVILCFNIGIDNFKNSSVAKIINGEKTGYKTLKEAWMAWNKSQNKVMQGLINRRNAEYKLYIQGGYEKW
ncbi:Phage-related lysozyme (muraminidase) (plasmid) [Campylobacter coli]|uniref:lysozyme n=8 Tax=Campylobacteraceae TaxID=72294 RepID=UPI0018A54452|nr:lysozyme [Campylobacter coli]QOP69328.1 Phage-related lysozyme (muraminidase) [Campylobacter coli]